MDAADGRSVDIFSAFAYEPSNSFPIDMTVQSERRQPLPTPVPPPHNASSWKRPGRGRWRREIPSKNPIPCSRNRTNTMSAASSSSTASPGGGKPVVVSRFFLPSHASSSLLTDAKSSRSRAPHAKAIGKRSGRGRWRREIPSKNPIPCSRNRTNTMLAASSSSTASPGGGKPVVVSRFFLPSHASSSLLTDAKSSRSRAPHAKAIGEPVAYFSAAEKKSEIYRRVADNNFWDPPLSDHHLLQELHSFDPWRVLTICILLNITTGIQVRRVLPSLFLLCPNAEAMSKADEEEVENVIRPLGLQKKRAKMLKKFSCEYLRKDWVYVTQLHGIGKYAADAYAIFCAGKIEEVNPRDHKLVDYWKFLSNKK